MSAAVGTVEPPFGPPDVEWKKDYDPLPEGVIVCGDSDGHHVYAGRICFENELLIGTVQNKNCTFSKDGNIHQSSEFQIMRVQVGEPLIWEKVSKKSGFPKNIVKAGKLQDGKVLYVGRLIENDKTSVGWVDKENAELHVEMDGKARVAHEFEVLVHKHLDFLVICAPCPRTCRRPKDEGN